MLFKRCRFHTSSQIQPGKSAYPDQTAVPLDDLLLLPLQIHSFLA